MEWVKGKAGIPACTCGPVAPRDTIMTQSSTSSDAWPKPFDAERFSRTALGFGHGGRLGMAWHGRGDGWVELILPWQEALVGDAARGVMASGPIIALMDMVTSLAAWEKQGHFRPQATLDLRVDYLRAAGIGNAIIGRGECYRVTRSIAFVRGIAHEGDPHDPVAHVAGSFMFTGEPWMAK